MKKQFETMLIQISVVINEYFVILKCIFLELAKMYGYTK